MKTHVFFYFAALLGSSPLLAGALPESQKIDALLAQDWQQKNLKPNPPAPDDVLVRRLYLDIVGRIPTAQESQEFIRSNDPQKRAKLIDTLLGSDGYTSHMFNYWADVLRLTDNTKGKVTADAYAEYVKKALKANTPYDQFVSNLLTTDGGVWDSGAIGFYQRDENKLDHLAYTVQVFLGTSIVCAQCHDHPFDKWSQTDYYGMAAYTYGMDTKGGNYNFLKGADKSRPSKEELANMTRQERKAAMSKRPAAAGLDRNQVEQVKEAMKEILKPLRYTDVKWTEGRLPALPADYKYPNAKPGDKISPKVMFGHEAVAAEGERSIDAFAKWMTSPENPRFTTVIANRMWKKAFGMGLIEPVDEMMDSTVPSNNALMTYLAELMIEKKYSLKSFLRVLYNTESYQRMATPVEVPLGETYHFTGPLLRRMSAEQVWDSMVTLAKGNVDHVTSKESEHLNAYLGDLKMLMTTLKEKGAPGLIEAAKEGAEQREANQDKIAKLKEEMTEAKASGEQTDVKKLTNEANKLRREANNDLLEAILGEERADGLKAGYNPGKDLAAMTKIDRSAMASLSREERREALKMGSLLSLTTRASELPSPTKAGHFLRTFGQSDRELIENASDDATVPQALALLNGPASEVLNNPISKLNQDLSAAATPSQKVDMLYLSLLSRHPTNNERAVLNQVIAERGDKALDDITHALLTGSQFLFIQ
jgi:hypothetical protein